MDIYFTAFDSPHHMGEGATHPLARLGGRLPLSLLVAGPGLLPRRFAAAARPDAPSDAPNCGFQDE